MKGKRVGQLLLAASEGILATVTDLVLIQIYLPLTLVGKKSPYEILHGFEEAQQLLRDINYRTIKRALYRLTAGGLITRSPKRSSLELAITKVGKKRIEEIIPTYHEHRPWDGVLYLVSYDIPTPANTSRDLLRSYLRSIGCGLLQESLWLAPYNPGQLLEEYSQEHRIPGTILVSRLGHDGSVGQEKLDALLTRVYHLDDLAKRYRQFIVTYESMTTPVSALRLSLDYFAILKDDPQLPFALLPPDFPAAAAYRRYQTILAQTTRTKKH